jgi:hypothetical protein
MGKNQDLGTGIRDKHPGFATLAPSCWKISFSQLKKYVFTAGKHSLLLHILTKKGPEKCYVYFS